MNEWKPDNLGPESRKAHARRTREGFFEKYFNGVVLDIGYRGYEETKVVPVLPDAIGVDLNYPGYNGRTLPFAEGSVDTVYASHTLEHISDPHAALREWFRVLKPGGHLVVAVPHQFLYEKRAGLPSRWNGDHKRFYTPARLMAEVEAALAPNTYRVRRLMDDDEEYDYSIPPERHAGGAYQVELTLQKIPSPAWRLEEAGEAPAALPAPAPESRGSAYRPPPAELAGYLRSGAVPGYEVVNTTGFFRNRAQHRALLGRLPGARVLVAGVSRGCEAWSLAAEAERLGLKLQIDAVDLDRENVRRAAAAEYHRSDFTDFDGADLLTLDVAKYFEADGDAVRVRPGAFSSRVRFRQADLFALEGEYDAVICNNVLIHFSPEAARRALGKLASLLRPGGVLASGGAPLEELAAYVSSAGFEPVEENLEVIWNGWRGDRLAWDRGEGGYTAMPPVDRSLPDWKARFCTLFVKDGVYPASLPPAAAERLAALARAARMACAAMERKVSVGAFAALLEAVNELLCALSDSPGDEPGLEKAGALLLEDAKALGAAAGACGACSGEAEAEMLIAAAATPRLERLSGLLLSLEAAVTPPPACEKSGAELAGTACA